MSFELGRISEELKAAPLSAPYAHALAVAIVCDFFRRAGLQPPATTNFDALMNSEPKAAEQLVMLAHVLRVTSARESTPKVSDALGAFRQFFDEISPLTGEMIRGNAFRQEEFLRKWAHAMGVPIAGETPKQSEERREALDYRRTTAEYAKAEAARKLEAQKRQEALAEAERRAAEARGWRE